MDAYPPGFEEDDSLRSDFVRMLTLQQLQDDRTAFRPERTAHLPQIPKKVVRFWHDADDVPADVHKCLETWDVLRHHGFVFRMFDDVSAAAYIAAQYGPREDAAFARCRHPAMRSDYLRMCFVLAEGGLYVDTDDVLVGEGWSELFCDSRLKIQALCYDTTAESMLPPPELQLVNLPTSGRIFYVNNNPIAAPPGHPVLRRALERATDILLRDDLAPEIQSTTGPGNLTAALVGHARELQLRGASLDFRLLLDWGDTVETRWDLAYRNDDRNWRNMDASDR